MEFLNWLRNLMERGLGAASNRYYAIYRGIVADNKDPDGLGRVKVYCPQVGQTAAPDRWVMPGMMGAGNGRGMFFVPEVNDTVWVSFYEGDPNLPDVWFGGWYGQVGGTSDVPQGLSPAKGDAPNKSGWTSRAGHAVIFNDTDGEESVTILWNRPAADDKARDDRNLTAALNTKRAALFTFNKHGGLVVKTPSSYVLEIEEKEDTDVPGTTGGFKLMTPEGSMITISPKDNINLIHKSGNLVSVNDKSIDISGNTAKQVDVNISAGTLNLNAGSTLIGGQRAVDFAVMGLKLIRWLATHTHGTGTGPSTPPIVPPTPADFCSRTIKVSE